MKTIMCKIYDLWRHEISKSWVFIEMFYRFNKLFEKYFYEKYLIGILFLEISYWKWILRYGRDYGFWINSKLFIPMILWTANHQSNDILD